MATVDIDSFVPLDETAKFEHGDQGARSMIEQLANFNFAAHLVSINEPWPLRLAFLDDSGEIQYGELAQRIKQFGSGLLEKGLKRGDRVLLVMPDRIEWPIAFLGAMYAGLIPVPANTLLTGSDYTYLLEHSDATAVIASTDLLAKLIEAGQSLADPVKVYIEAESPQAPSAPSGSMTFNAVEKAGVVDFVGADTQPSDVAFWLYSSGSTGRPKGVLHTHANLYWTAELYAKPVMGITKDDRIFSAAKLFFAYGLGNALTFPMSVGAAAILMAARPTPATVLERLFEQRATIFCGAPTLYASLLASEEASTLGSVRLCTSAGEALPSEVGARFFKKFGVDILDGLGSTEMLHIFVSNRPSDVLYGTTGLPVEGYAVQLRDENEQVVEAAGQIGDLWVKGPSAALAYWKDAAKSQSTFRDGWVRTGDKYTWREDGRLIYAGRNDDMLKISGQYVSPFEVESTLVQHPFVQECAVIAITDSMGIFKSKAFVVLRPGMVPSDDYAEELKNFVKARLAPFKRPHYVEFVVELPKTATGKIQRFRLRDAEGPPCP